MSDERGRAPVRADSATVEFEREIGRFETGRRGPLLIVVAGVHGNEPSGVHAARRVLRLLRERRPPLRGRFAAFCGNLTALDERVRFVDRDLNRVWSEAPFRAGESEGVATDDNEAREQSELRAAVSSELADAGPEGWERVVALDLHSTSAAGAPFSILGDTLQNRSIALSLPIPAILGLEENVPGTLLEWFGRRGHTAVCVEGGQHDAAATVDNHESTLWLALVSAGLLRAEEVPDHAGHRARLEGASGLLPRVLEIRFRRGIRAGERFRMCQGFGNFQRVNKGELLAHAGTDGGAPVRAPRRGHLLMPRYQEQGDDGFFLSQRVRPIWLVLSRLLRRTGLERLLPLLPGVGRHPDEPRSLRANRRVVRWFAREIFHLFGYRSRRPDGRYLIFSRRNEGPTGLGGEDRVATVVHRAR